MSSWACSKCTFLNPPFQKSSCQICLSTPPPSVSASSSSLTLSKPKWPCKSCTFLNPFDSSCCEICGNRFSSSLLSRFDEEEELGSGVGSVFLPLQPSNTGKNRDNPVEVDAHEIEGGCGPLNAANKVFDATPSPLQPCSKRIIIEIDDTDSGGFRASKATSKAVTSWGYILERTAAKTGLIKEKMESKELKIMTYNVWFREDLEMLKRMKALGELIQQHSPDVICFQEVTPNIYDIFQQSSWWKVYHCSVPNEMSFTRPYFCMQLSKLSVKSYSCKPFRNSVMGRELCVAEIDTPDDKKLVVATSHLESPCPAPPKWDQMYSKERVEQAKEALKFLEKNPNVIFCGDMNWDDKMDGQFPLLDGWIDAWAQHRPGEYGYTYDTKSNKMLSGNRSLQKRLDRFMCSLRDFRICGIDMIGMDEIPGVSYVKEKKVKTDVKKLVLPVLASDHYGLLLKISPR